jgi:hypothetical protein
MWDFVEHFQATKYAGEDTKPRGNTWIQEKWNNFRAEEIRFCGISQFVAVINIDKVST